MKAEPSKLHLDKVNMIDATTTETGTTETKTETVLPARKPMKRAGAKPAPVKPAAVKPAAAVTVSRSSEGLNKLRVGDTFLRKGIIHVVYFLNESRACVAAIDDLTEYRVSDDKMIKFAVPAGKTSEDIGPNSELEVLASLGREGLAKYIDDRKAKIAVARTEERGKRSNYFSKAAKTAAKPVKAPKAPKVVKPAKVAKAPGIRSGRLGDYKGYSIASVIRALGAKGWDFAECRAFLTKNRIESSDQTIKLNIYRGVNKRDGEIAPLKPEEYPVKPVIKTAAKEVKENKPVIKTVAKEAKPVKAAPVIVKKPVAGDRAAAQIAQLKAAKLAKLSASAAA